MNREDIILMARRVGASTEIKHVTVGNGDGIVFTPDELDLFADLVAARTISNIDPSQLRHSCKGAEMSTQPEALRLAEEMSHHKWRLALDVEEAVAELRRLHALNGELLAALRDLVDAITGRLDGETIELHNALAVIKKAEGA